MCGKGINQLLPYFLFSGRIDTVICMIIYQNTKKQGFINCITEKDIYTHIEKTVLKALKHLDFSMPAI